MQTEYRNKAGGGAGRETTLQVREDVDGQLQLFDGEGRSVWGVQSIVLDRRLNDPDRATIEVVLCKGANPRESE